MEENRNTCLRRLADISVPGGPLATGGCFLSKRIILKHKEKGQAGEVPAENKTMKTIDGNTAAAHVAYAMSDVATIYPITPSSPIGEIADEWAANGRKNIFGQNMTGAPAAVRSREPRRSVHGSLAGGADLDLHGLPGAAADDPQHVQDVRRAAARRFSRDRPGHCRPCPVHFRRSPGCHGRAPDRLCPAGSARSRKPMDLALVAHLAAIEASVPFLHFFDGFRTSHEIQKIE
jgi:pyruvate-ferredoxin/flavodoxin oxidoreductase